MNLDFKMLDFQLFLDIDQKIGDILTSQVTGKAGTGAEKEIAELLELKEDYEDNFIMFFHYLRTDPGFALRAYKELSIIDNSAAENITDEETYVASYASSDLPSINELIPGKCWRYSEGEIVNVGCNITSVNHPFNEDDILEIITREDGEHQYSYWARHIDSSKDEETYLINDEELE